MSKYFILIIIVFIAVSCQNKQKENNIKPKTSDITESVYASVKVRPEVSYSPQPIHSGIIKKIYVQEGDFVEKGKILFQISPTAAVQSQLTNAEINLEEAKSNYLGNNNLLNNIQLEIKTVKEQLSLDSINYKRQDRLWAQNIGRKTDLDQFKLKYQTTQKQLDILRQKFVQTRTNLENNYKKALSKTETEKSQLADFTVRSEIDGKVYSLNKEVGDFISTQERFAEIGSSDTFKLEMDIDEVDITKIELGDSVLIILDAYEGQVFVATVNKIFPKKDDITQTFRVESSFKQLPPKLYYGLAGEANIVVDRRNNTVVIPAEYLLPNDKVMTNDGEKSIKIGLKNLEFVEILSGIDTSTTILKPSE